MALQFNPPEWLIQEYLSKKQPAQIASEGINQALQTYATQKQLDQQKKQQELQNKNAASKNVIDLIAQDPELANTPFGKRMLAEAGGDLAGYTPPGTVAPTQDAPMPSIGGVQPPVASTGTAPSPMGAPSTESPIIAHFNTLGGRGKMGEKAQGQIKTGMEVQKLAQGLADQPIYDATGKRVGVAPSNAHFLPPGALPPKPAAPPPGFRYSQDGQSLEVIPGGPVAIKQGAENEKLKTTFELYETARQGLMEGLGGSMTGPFAGSLPAVTESQQVARGSVAAMAPVLKQLFRVAGEGIFTDKDQELLMQMIPTRTTRPEARIAQINNIDRIVKAKLGMGGTGGGAPGGSATPQQSFIKPGEESEYEAFKQSMQQGRR